ncbi:sugar ABC transporter [Gracilibacillus boraciitolerans JCM 21714]|uniref:Sugar ABC transporter n=1 Tax=Gracilibacillus boraciitolerans JCM 21714 TaxID=1298598 RepID=W4VHX3_9BACI|nr:extracellular solute-binding protein [Gracilibacillus boraciitolerans]GAE92766.1 sugar ABC transporter [Gracilibacillus boraciitolerans JCM 21714]
MILIISACGGDDGSITPEDNNEGDSAEESEGKTEVLLWHHYTSSAELLNKFLEEFNNSQEDIVVKSEYVPFSEMNRQLSVGTAGDSLPDMILADTVNNVSMASMGILADLTDRINEWGGEGGDQFLNGPMNSTVYKDKNYGLPLTTNSLGLFYNKNLFEEAGIEEPPTTWGENWKKLLTN